jgi:DNA-binding transcriptional MerR regulator
MPYKEKPIEKMYYTIGEVADMLSVNTSHIRFWSKQFDIIKPATNKKGNRLFTAKDIENFKVIFHLVKEKGFTLKGAKVEMQQMRKKMRIEQNALSVSASESTETVEPILDELPFEKSDEPKAKDFVERLEIVKSLQRIKQSLTDMQKGLLALE